jgi:hypothetical protein
LSSDLQSVWAWVGQDGVLKVQANPLSNNKSRVPTRQRYRNQYMGSQPYMGNATTKLRSFN